MQIKSYLAGNPPIKIKLNDDVSTPILVDASRSMYQVQLVLMLW